jgi:hypothetical protein
MTVVLTGVPSFGLNVLTAPPSTVQLVKAWVDFYETYKSDLVNGRIDVFGSFSQPNHLLESYERMFVFLRETDGIPLQTGNKKDVFLFNASDSDSLNVRLRLVPNRRYVVAGYDRFMNEITRTTRAADRNGLMSIQSETEQGGFLRVTPLLQQNIRGGVRPGGTKN